MKRSKLLLASFLVLMMLGCGTETSPSDPEPVSHVGSEEEVKLVQEDVRKMSQAVYDADIPTILDYTHPTIIEKMGGRSQVESALKGMLSQVQSIGMKLESMTFPAAPDFLETEERRFVIVPTKSIVSANGQQLESLNYQFGIQEKGTTAWKYIEGSRINQQNVRSLFPDFPPNYQFPEIYRKKL
ncbi:MAG: hypothetical protein PVH19_03760 [Planctomycetia bacterium]|jgi:hypothetical protein